MEKLSISVWSSCCIKRIKIKDVTNQLGKFDETGIQLLSTHLPLYYCVCTTIFILPTSQPTFYYLMISLQYF